MTARYYVRLKDQEGVPTAVFTTWRGLNVHMRVNEIGSFNMTIFQSDERVPLFLTDGQIEVFRNDADHQVDWTLEWEGLIRNDEFNTFEAGAQNYIVTAYSYLDILRRRNIMYRPGTPYTEKSMDGVLAMKQYVEENAGPSALTPPRLLRDGVFPGLEVLGGGYSGRIWEGSQAYKNLLAAVKEIGAACGIDYDIVGTNLADPWSASYAFYTYPGQRGRDFTTEGLNPATGKNAAGNSPVIFSLDLGTVRRANLNRTHSAEANAIFVLGPGEDEDREIVLVYRPSAIVPDSNACEMTVDARNADQDEIPLELIGYAALEDHKATEKFSFVPHPNDAVVYRRDFALGDKVTVYYRGVAYHKRIVSIDISVSPQSGEQMVLDFDDVQAVDFLTASTT